MLLASTLKCLQNHALYRQFARFVTVGIVSAVMNYSIYSILLYFMQLKALIASASAFLGGTMLGYKLNSAWSFQTPSSHQGVFIKYLSVYLCSLLLSLWALHLLVNTFGMSPYIAQFAVIALTTCTNFIGIKIWVFK